MTAVLLSYNSADTLAAALDAVDAQTHPVRRLVVVDNGSVDGSVDLLRSRLSDDDLVLLRHNVGVGKGHAVGWELALADASCTHVWSLEHDTVPAPDCLAALLGELDGAAGPVGALVPRQHLPLVTTSRRLRLVARAQRRRSRTAKRRLDATGAPHAQSTFSFNGTLFPATALRAVGPPRADFVVGKEDRELAWRMRRAGLVVLRVPAAEVTHLHREFWGLPSASRTYYSTRNGVYLDVHLVHRPGARLRAIGGLGPSLVKIALLGGDKRARVRAKLAGVRDGLDGRLGFREPVTEVSR